MQNVIKILATFFYIGYLPITKGKGTLSALAALVLYYFMKDNILTYALVTLFLVLSGFLVSGRAEKIFKKKDAPEIVIDDANGMLVALFLVPQAPAYIIGAFITYRLFDIFKPFPIRRLESLRGSAGVMLDDIAAGLYTNIILQTIRYTLYTIH